MECFVLLHQLIRTAIQKAADQSISVYPIAPLNGTDRSAQVGGPPLPHDLTLLLPLRRHTQYSRHDSGAWSRRSECIVFSLLHLHGQIDFVQNSPQTLPAAKPTRHGLALHRLVLCLCDNSLLRLAEVHHRRVGEHGVFNRKFCGQGIPRSWLFHRPRSPCTEWTSTWSMQWGRRRISEVQKWQVPSVGNVLSCYGTNTVRDVGRSFGCVREVDASYFYCHNLFRRER